MDIEKLSINTESLQKKAPSLRSNKDPEKMRQVAEDFEAFFLSQLVGVMFQGIKTEGPFGGGMGEEMYRSLMVQEYGKILAKSRGGIGIADAVMTEMIRLQGEAA